MLKIWKQKWKDTESTGQASQEDRDQEAFQGEGSSSSFATNDTAAVSPSQDHVLDSVSPFSSQTSLAAQHNPLETGIPDSLRAGDTSRMSLSSLEAFGDQVLDHVKRKNTIAVYPPSQIPMNVFAKFLSWSAQVLQGRSPVDRRRLALYVVDDDRLVTKHATAFQAEALELDVGLCREYGDLANLPQAVKKDVLVTTSALLHAALVDGKLSIDQFHAIIIADAQNVTGMDCHGSLPLVQVMDRYYRASDAALRPRILAVVSRTMGHQPYFDHGMLKLEMTLDAKTVGVSAEKRAEFLRLPDNPDEIVLLYDPPSPIPETGLLQQLHSLERTNNLFRRELRASLRVLTEIGTWASDHVWQCALKEIESPLQRPNRGDDEQASDQRTRKKFRGVIENWDFTGPVLDMTSHRCNITPKMLRLIQVLRSYESYGTELRAIVFVREASVATAIAELIRNLPELLAFLRPCILIGHGKSASPLNEGIFRTFANGTHNLLVVTKSAEDLEIPRACLVVRFDLLDSPLSYAYSRSCARGREGHIVHLIERGNDAHRRILADNTRLDETMSRWVETLTRLPQSSIPPVVLQETSNSCDSDIEDDGEEFIEDPTTGGRIYLHQATTVVYRFASALREQIGDSLDTPPLFKFRDRRRPLGLPITYVCKVLLPGTSANAVEGSPSPSIAFARRNACYEVCRKLDEQGVLDYRYFYLPSTSSAGPHRYRDNSLSPHSVGEPELLDLPPLGDKFSGTRCYPKQKPVFWTIALSGQHTTLHPTIVMTEQSDESSPYAPIVILTRRPLPELPSFRIFLSGIPASVQLIRGASFDVNEKKLRDLSRYTLRVCRTIANKPFTCSVAEMPYFVAPLALGWTPPTGKDAVSISDIILWESVTLAGGTWAVPLKFGPISEVAADFNDAVVLDRWTEFTRRYSVVKIRPDMTPLTKPDDSAREAGFDNLVEYCRSRKKDFQELKDNGQCIIEVCKLPGILNHLNPASRPMTESPKAAARYLIPELCAKFVLPASTLRSALLLPSVIRRIDELLLVKQLNFHLLQHALPEDLLHMAISAPSAGNEYDYERLELLGDAFLKYLTSIYVFVNAPTHGEGALHVARQNIISNKTLFHSAARVGLPSFILAKQFALKGWHPPSFRLEGRPGSKDAPVNDTKSVVDGNSQARTDGGYRAAVHSDEQTRGDDSNLSHLENLSTENSMDTIPDLSTQESQTLPSNSSTAGFEGKRSHKAWKKKRHQDDDSVLWLGDKAIADVAEAIIGAAYVSGGRDIALKVAKALTLPIANVEKWSDFGRKALLPPATAALKLRRESIVAVENIIGHKFKRPHLLAQALTHGSIKGFEPTSFERLEFIGDAILDFTTIRHLFDRDHQLSPGALTLLKGAMVSNSALAAVCVRSGLYRHLVFDSNGLTAAIKHYVDQLKVKELEEYQKASEEGRSPGQYWVHIEPQKALSDLVESIVGALYISDDFSPIGVEAFFNKVLKPFYNRHITLKTISHHPTKILFELVQAGGCKEFQIIREDNEDGPCCLVLVHDVILASGQDATPSSAARRASLLALDALEGDVGFLSRTCDCRTQSQIKKPHRNTFMSALSGFEDSMGDFLEDERGS